MVHETHTYIHMYVHHSYPLCLCAGDLRGVAGGDGELGCLCGKAGTGHLCDGSAHSSGCVVNGYGLLLSYCAYMVKQCLHTCKTFLLCFVA